MVSSLRPFQAQAIDRLRRAISAGSRALILSSPTGSGKTMISSAIAAGAVAKGRRVAFFAPRRELIRQASATFGRAQVPHGIVMAGQRRCPQEPAQICSWDTLRSWLDKGRIGRAPGADLVIVDEAHLSVAPTYLRILREHYSNAIILGLTATPARGDGRGLGMLYEQIIQAATVQELTEDGYLVPARYFEPTPADLSGLKQARGDFESAGIEQRWNTPKMVGDVVEQWGRIAPDRQTVVFANSVAHALSLRDRFRDVGVRADYIHGGMQRAERDVVTERVYSGASQVVVNVDVLTFGFDAPALSCVVLARPTKSLVRYHQTVGRVLRPAPGKEDAIVIDHGGVRRTLGRVSDPVEWTLSGAERVQDRVVSRRKKESEPITCGECSLVYEHRRDCPACGWEPPRKRREVAFVEGDLLETDEQGRTKQQAQGDRLVEQARFYAELRGVAQQRGYKDGWAANKFKEKFGTWPNHPSLRNVAPREPGPAMLSWVKSRQIAFAKGKAKAKQAGVTV
ncbi:MULTISPECIES: DEAD/DEAH box helicase [Halorhodospira]|uniref:DEAD/DEAH box helicase n=1 Tax=Halorhodospira TaxID=85108 RepID=UPI001EE7E8CD|nr:MULTISPECIES: DEAD/DEAH box helicase [Halorhodospira]MCG5526870.1 DEAD/DEAH box helicase [Halorhodospira halophila]MCG5542793.1 DEAD/DEAH box helicase [Halorhodospira sp. 9628]